MKNSLQLLAIIVLVAAFNLTTTAQKMSKKIYNGYVVLADGEKMEGQIRMLTPALNEVKVSFISADGKKQIFKAEEVLSYAFEVAGFDVDRNEKTTNMVTYVRRNVEEAPIAFGPKDVLVHQEAKGSLNLFNHYVERPADKKMPLVHTFYVQKENQEMVSLNKDNYKEVLNNMTTDYPELQAKVGTRGYGFKYVGKIVKEYNYYKENNSEEYAFDLK